MLVVKLKLKKLEDCKITPKFEFPVCAFLDTKLIQPYYIHFKSTLLSIVLQIWLSSFISPPYRIVCFDQILS